MGEKNEFVENINQFNLSKIIIKDSKNRYDFINFYNVLLEVLKRFIFHFVMFFIRYWKLK